MSKKLRFDLLPDYAKFLLENKLQALVDEQIHLSFALNIPMLEYFREIPMEQLKKLSAHYLSILLEYFKNNEVDIYIEQSLKSWKDDQLPLLRGQIIADDIGLTFFVRKQILLKFITDYTQDVATILKIVNELDIYTLEAESAGFRTYTNIQQELINKQLSIIQQSESYYKKAEELTHIGNWRWDIATGNYEWTDELYRMHEIEIGELITTEKLQALNHIDDAQFIKDTVAKSFKTKEPFDFFYRIVLKDKKEKVLHSIGQVLPGEDGNNIKLLGTLQDVTEQKKIERLITEKQNLIEKITNLAPSIIASYNIHTGNYIFINEALKTLLGYEKEQVFREGAAFFMNLLHPDDIRIMVEKNNQAIIAANAFKTPAEQEAIVDFQYRMRHKDGNYRWFHTFGTVFDRDSNNKVEHVLNITLDITAEHTLKLELEKENAFAEMLIDNSPDMIMVFDKDLKVKAWNRKSEERHGILREKIIGKSWIEFFPHYNNERWLKDMERVFNGELVHYPKITMKYTNGFAECFTIPLQDANKEITGALAITRNITELVEAYNSLESMHNELKQNEERYHKMINEVQDYAIIFLDKDGLIQNWNKGAQTIKKYETEEIIGNHFSIFYTEEDQKNNLPEKLLQRAVKSGRAAHEGWRVRKDGSKFWGSIVLTAVHGENNEIIGFSKVTRDLTERKLKDDEVRHKAKQLEQKNKELQISNAGLKEAREELAKSRTRSLIEAMPHIVVTINPEGTLEYANQHLTDFTGLSLNAFKEGKWKDAIHPDDLKKLLYSLKTVIVSRHSFQMEFRLKRSDGEYLWHLGIAKSFPQDNHSADKSYLITLTNIHDQKLLDEKKDEFIGIASHELKTPLTSVKAYTQILQIILNKENNAEALVYVNKANTFIERLNSLISELLDITKIQHGKLQLKIASFHFNELITETVEFMQSASPSHTFNIHGKADNLINGDKERIQQVLINLFSNATKYSPEAKIVDIYISTSPGKLFVIVKDYGIGIPKSDCEKIFQRFYRVEDKSTKFQGLGIGLFISHEIIKRHKGDLWAESELGKGSEFYLTLPL